MSPASISRVVLHAHLLRSRSKIAAPADDEVTAWAFGLGDEADNFLVDEFGEVFAR